MATVGHRWIGDRIVNNIVSVSSGGSVEAFTRLADGTYNPPALSTARLMPDASSNWIYTASNGTQFKFDTVDQTTTSSGSTTVNSGYQPIYRLATALAPNGLTTRFTYDSKGHQVTYVYNSLRRQLLLTWTGNSITKVSEYSSGVAQRSISLGYDASNDLSTITDPRGKSTLFCSDGSGRITSYFHPDLVTAGATCGGSITPTITNTYDSLGRVSQQVDAGAHVTDFYLAGSRAEVVTHPGAAGIPGVPDISTVNYLNGRGQTIVAVSPRTGKPTTTTYDNLGRAIRVVQPEGNAAEVRYDERSNPYGRCWIAKPPVGQQAPPCNWAGATGQILTSTKYGEGTSNGGSFVFNCANPPICNLPVASFDAIGDETDYAYNPNGTIATVTLPTPAGAAAAPQTSYAYTAYTMGSDTVSLPTYVANRIDSATNTIGTTYTYDTANNWVVKTSTVDSPGFNLTTTFGTDAIGNVTSVKGPRTDVDDTVTTAYDAARNPTQLSYPGTLVAQLTYDDDGHLLAIARKLGANWSVACRTYTTTGQAASAFGPVIQASPTDCSFAGNTAVPLVQYQYDGADRLIRTSAVNTTETRTTRLDLLPDNRVGTVTRAEGTPVAQAYATVAYTDNGLPQTVTNALGRPTTSTYDGYDRLAQTAYPTPTGTVSATDVVDYSYDPRGLVLTRSLRGTTACPACLTFTYDALGRTASKAAPAIGTTPGYTITYGYDLLGHMLSAGTSGSPELTFAYDKLGRATSAVQYGRTLGYAYGPASQGFARTVTWPSTATALSCTDALGRTVQVKESADCTTTAGQLVGYAYDDLSRRTGATDANGTASVWGYDPTTGALTSLSHTFASTASNVAFTLARNRVQEVTTYGIGNALYEWTNHYNVARQYAANALDQYTSIGGLGPSYDARGNLTANRLNLFAYDAENRLVAATQSGVTVGLAYDPLGRLRQTSAATSTQFLYDGSALVAEYDAASGATLARYVPGPGSDETVVVYDGSGAKSWLHTDPLGSVIATSDATGATATIDEYGPWGEPGLALPGHNSGRIRYTGQLWIPEIALYHFKARAYAPLTGRFLQTDPIGAADDANLYSYVGNDPVNRVDPSGLYADQAVTSVTNFLKPAYDNFVDAASAHPYATAAAAVGTVAVGACFAVGPCDAAAAVAGAARLGLSAYRAVTGAAAAEGAAESEGVSTLDQLSAAANRAATTVGPGRGPVYGTAVHSVFQDEVDALGNANLATEQSYLNGRLVDYGTPGSVRLDVVEGPLTGPAAVYDLKTGSATLTPARIQQVQSHLPGSGSSVPVIEVRP